SPPPPKGKWKFIVCNPHPPRGGGAAAAAGWSCRGELRSSVVTAAAGWSVGAATCRPWLSPTERACRDDRHDRPWLSERA
ncbi:MAG: hypothetical protein FWH14_07830, partial [Oscillospiraceae bacterium]|nr:hypothetical protein [Oscillospiraceae bacterium]